MLFTSALPLGFRYASEGTMSFFDQSRPVYSTRGRVVMPSQEITFWDRVIRTFGFTPRNLADRRRLISYGKYMKRRPRTAKDRFITKVTRHLVNADNAFEAKDMVKYHAELSKLEEIYEDIREINEEAIKSGRLGDIINMDNKTIKNRAMVQKHGGASEAVLRQVLNRFSEAELGRRKGGMEKRLKDMGLLR